MTQDNSVLISEEYGRIIDFLLSRIDSGILTQTDWEIVKAEETRVHHEVGYIDKQGKFLAAAHDELDAVTKRVNRLMRQKIGELRPELGEELDRWISEVRYPLPPLPPELEVPGVALKEYRDLIRYVEDKKRKRLITDADAYGATDLGAHLIAENGIERFEIDLNTDKAVLHGAAELVRRKLLDARPDLADEIASLGRSGPAGGR